MVDGAAREIDATLGTMESRSIRTVAAAVAGAGLVVVGTVFLFGDGAFRATFLAEGGATILGVVFGIPAGLWLCS